MVTALPEIRKETLQPGDDFLLLACDGIWDVLTNQEVGGAWDM
jgi:protein phosphatase 1G